MKKKYDSPEFDVTFFKFNEEIMGNFFSDPGTGSSTGDDPKDDPFA